MTFLVWGLGVAGTAIVASLALLLAIYASPYAGGAVALAAPGGAMLVLAILRGRHERGLIHRRHCLECGTAVADDAGFCPHCRSVRLEAAVASVGREPRVERELPVGAYSSDRSGVIGWVDAAPPGTMGGSTSATKTLGRWGAILLGLSLLLAILGATAGR
jgi:hypothetical protein